MKNLKYYVVDTLLNEVSKGFTNYSLAEIYISKHIEEVFFEYQERSRYLIIPKWKE